MTELSLTIWNCQDLLDYESMRRGLDALGRISGISVGDALASIVTAATPEQRERLIKRCEHGEEFYRLPEELQARLRWYEQGDSARELREDRHGE
jgi:hypothetical protein